VAEEAFARFPAWMWRNREVHEFTEWLHAHNASRPPESMAEFRGLDVHSLRGSIAAVLDYLDKTDPAMAAAARRLLADSFVIMTPLRTQRLRAIPFWLLLGVEPSADHLARFLGEQQVRRGGPVPVLARHRRRRPRAHQGMAASRPARAVAGAAARVDPRRFPSDFATFARFHRTLETLAPVQETPPPLALGRFETLLRQHAVAASGVEVVERPAPALAV